jgi:phosphonate transport system substrate-binding protein
MGKHRLLRFTSCQSENSEFIGRALTRYIGERLGLATQFVDSISWQQRLRLLDEGVIHSGWVCGLPYVLRADRPRPRMELLAAPVMAGARYARRPVYFSDIVVRHDSPARSFLDLRGSRWGYNEPRSHSGYEVVRYHLSRLGECTGFFGTTIETGAHQETLRLILDREVDASAIDSTVLETELRRRPALREELCVIETLGPSPVPPWIVSQHLPQFLKRRLRGIMLGMHRDPGGRAILREASIARFAGVTDRDYDPIRRMSRAAANVVL